MNLKNGLEPLPTGFFLTDQYMVKVTMGRMFENAATAALP